jgi:hypothetical protein
MGHQDGSAVPVAVFPQKAKHDLPFSQFPELGGFENVRIVALERFLQFLEFFLVVLPNVAMRYGFATDEGLKVFNRFFFVKLDLFDRLVPPFLGFEEEGADEANDEKSDHMRISLPVIYDEKNVNQPKKRCFAVFLPQGFAKTITESPLLTYFGNKLLSIRFRVIG